MTKLRWTGGNFRDGKRGFSASPNSVHEFEDEERVEEYLSHRSGDWERVEEGEAATDDDTDSTNEATDDDDAGDGAGEATDESDPAGEDSDTADSSEDEVTAEDVATTDNWREAKDIVESGAVDDELEAAKKAEKARENGPRDSVLGAIESRQEE